MAEMFGFDAFSPKEIAARVETIGVAKARLPLLSMFMLAMLAGAFIGLGGLYFVLVRSDPTLGFALGQVLGGLVFSPSLCDSGDSPPRVEPRYNRLVAFDGSCWHAPDIRDASRLSDQPLHGRLTMDARFTCRRRLQ